MRGWNPPARKGCHDEALRTARLRGGTRDVRAAVLQLPDEDDAADLRLSTVGRDRRRDRRGDDAAARAEEGSREEVTRGRSVRETDVHRTFTPSAIRARRSGRRTRPG